MAKFRIFLKNTLLLTLTSLLMRTVAVYYNVYLTKRLGADGMGLFTLTGSVYGLAVTLATSAVTLASTRLVSEAMGESIQGKEQESGRILAAMKVCILYSLFFGCLAGGILFLYAAPIGKVVLSDARTIPSLRLLALSLPFVALTSALSGYFTAVRRVSKNAVTQIFEQGLRIGATMLLLTFFTTGGLTQACLWVVAGGVLGNLFSFLYCFVLYLLDLRKFHAHQKADVREITPMRKKLLGIALPVAFSSYLRQGLVTLEHLLIPWGLKKKGDSQTDALATYGIMQGMALPVVMFPYAFLSPFCNLLIPEVAEKRAAGDMIGVQKITERVFRFVLTMGIGTAGIFLCLSSELGMIVADSREAAGYIRLLAPLVPIMYLDTAVDSILKGLDEQLFCMRVNILDAALSVLVVLVLLPRVGIYGYIIEIFACELINASLSVMRLMQVMEVKLSPWIAVKPLLAVFGATVLSRFLFAWILPVAMNGMGLFLHIAMIALLYVGLLYLPQLMGRLWKSARVRLHPRKTAATMGECAIR
ncbi:MAG: polysaccharide biosynthesis C-terminal domain-containing protein [Clostridia bacterium]|nr:polysaccharide biosynthesis C-terminal domain-containing protein [Clostridia bacterium]